MTFYFFLYLISPLGEIMSLGDIGGVEGQQQIFNTEAIRKAEEKKVTLTLQLQKYQRVSDISFIGTVVSIISVAVSSAFSPLILLLIVLGGLLTLINGTVFFIRGLAKEEELDEVRNKLEEMKENIKDSKETYNAVYKSFSNYKVEILEKYFKGKFEDSSANQAIADLIQKKKLKKIRFLQQ